MKKCSCCKKLKKLKSFGRDQSKDDKLNSRCIKCCRKQNKKSYKKHKQKILKKGRDKYKENPEIKLLAIKTYRKTEKGRLANSNRVKKWSKKNRHKINKYIKLKCTIDIEFKLKRYLRTRLYGALKKQYKTGSAVKDLGCTIAELKQHLESKFQPGMTWDNYGKWHIDHICPLASFNLKDREQLLIVCNYTNLQPLWAKDNIQKRDKNG
jgi:hypothetical protein